MKKNILVSIFAFLFFLIISLPSSADDAVNGGSGKDIVIHDDYVEGLKIEFDVSRGGFEGEVNIDAPVKSFDESVYGDQLMAIPFRDAWGNPPLDNAFYHENEREGDGREDPKNESDGPIKWTPQDAAPEFVPPNPMMECKPTPASLGYFTAFFEEVELQNGEGYDHSIHGAARRNEVCKVLKDVALLIDMGTSKPQIVFYKDPGNIPSNALAYASTYFSNNQGFHGGALWQNIVSGIDPIPGAGNFDGYVVTNFYNDVVWDVDAPSAPASYDLYTVLYHEVLHAMGFVSRIPPAITQAHLDGSAWGGYSNFDKFLYAAASSTLKLLNPIAPPFLNNPYTGTIGAPSPELISNQDVFGSSDFPVYSPASWEEGSSMSHFDQNRGGTVYIMHPSIELNTSKVIHANEKAALCDIGYSVNGFTCGNQPPVAVDDVDLVVNQGNVGEQVCVNFKANDYDPDGDSFGLLSMEVVLGGNAGSLTYWNQDQTIQLAMTNPQTSVVCYASAFNFQGIALLEYFLKDAAGISNKGSIKIKFNSDICIDDPTNYICNGEFEQGGSPNGILVLGSGNVPFWYAITNTPDILRREYSATMPFKSWFFQGPDTYNGAPNNRYFTGFRDIPFGESAYTTLVRPIDPNKTYTLSFYFHRAVVISNGLILAPVVYLSEEQPTSSDTNEYEASGTDQILYSETNVLSEGWESITTTFSPASSNHKYLIIKSKLLNTAQYGHSFFGFDAMAIRESGGGSGGGSSVDVGIIKWVNNSSPNIEDEITYVVRVQNLGSDTATNIHIADYLPQDVMHISHTEMGATNGLNATVTGDGWNVNDGLVTWEIDQLTSMEWIDLTVTVKVLVSAECQTLRNVAVMTQVDQTDVSAANHYVEHGAAGFPFTQEIENYIGKVDAYVQCSGKISGHVFNDLNQNGVQDGGESSVASMQAELYREENGQPVIPAIAAAFSSADPLNYGAYQFNNIAPGTYYVKLNNPASWSKTYPLPGSIMISGDNRLHEVNVNGDSHQGKDFGIHTSALTDISVTKGINGNSPELGDVLAYSVKVKNNGPVSAANVRVLDIMPNGTALFSFTSSLPGVTYDSATGLIVIPSLQVGQTATLTFKFKVNVQACGHTVVNTAAFQSMDGGVDSNPANNVASVLFKGPECLPFDLRITKTLSSVQVSGGTQILNYKITVKNIGMNDIHNIKAKDHIPSNTQYVSHAWTGPGTVSYTSFIKTLFANIPVLIPGESTTITLKVKRVNNNPVVNTAVITAMQEMDQNMTNNSATHTHN